MQTVFAWTLISVGLVGGLVAPFMLRAKKQLKVLHVVGWILWFLFAFVISQFIVGFIMLAVGEKTTASVEFTALFQAVTYLLTFCMMILLPWRLWKDSQKPPKKKSKKQVKVATRTFILKLSGLGRWPNLGDIKRFLILLPLYYVTLMAASFAITIIAMLIFGHETATQIMGQDQNVGFDKGGHYGVLSLSLIFFCLVILAPLFEEMLIRGALFGKLRDKLKFWPAALFTAGVFALLHGQINVGIMTFILAMYAAFLREKTGAIWSGIMLHMTQNLIAFYLIFLK